MLGTEKREVAVIFGVREKEKRAFVIYLIFFFSVISSVSIYCERSKLEMAYSVINGKQRVQFGLDIFNFWSQVGDQDQDQCNCHESRLF